MIQLLLLISSLLSTYDEVDRILNDPYTAAIVAAEASGLNDVMVGYRRHRKHGALWLVATGMSGSRLTDLRRTNTSPYDGTAIHKIDAWVGRMNYANAVERGLLRPDRCIFHRDDGTPVARGRIPYDSWSTRGPYEAMIHDKLTYLGWDCFPIDLVDVPLINAIMVANYAKHMCKKYGMTGGRYSDRRCDWRFLRCVWAGVGSCNDETFRHDVERRFMKWIFKADKLFRERGVI